MFMPRLLIVMMAVWLSVAAVVVPATAQTTVLDPQTIYERVAPAVGVVRIMTDGRAGVGTGFTIDRNGLVLTAAHVARRTAALLVEFPGARPLTASLVGFDARRDIALLQVTAPAPLPVVEVFDGGLRAGESVVVIGTPRGRPGIMTVGEIVAPRATLPGLAPEILIRINAEVAPGNSGGPVLNARGQVVGLVIARGREGDALAVSGATLHATLPALRQGARVERPWIGIAGRTVSPELAQERRFTVEHGALIQEIVPDSPGAAAGLHPDDVIVALDGRPISSWEELLGVVADREPGQQVRLTVVRGGGRLDVQVTLAARP